MNPCPCGSLKNFLKCCRPYLIGRVLPETAEALMRSRYSAYSRVNVAYIEATMRGTALEGFNKTTTKAWAQSVKWLGLKIVKTEAGTLNDTHGTVEFIASYKEQGQLHQIHEISEFKKIDGRWFYISGSHRP